MSASIRRQLEEGLKKLNTPEPTITLVRNLKAGDEFDLSNVAMPKGYRLIVRAVAPEPGETEMVKVFFEDVLGHTTKAALMNGNFPVSVIRRNS